MKKRAKKFVKTFKELKIPVSPLPDNYTPDSYGWSLVNGKDKKSDISYSNDTKIIYKV